MSIEVEGALAAARDVTEVGEVARSAARRLADAQGATFVVRDGDDCFYADEDAIAPLWKGQRFPVDHCISVWAMLNVATATIPDIEKDPRIPLEAYRPTFVRSVVMVPVGTDHPVAAIGVYWSDRRSPEPAVIEALERLAADVAEALDRVGLENAPWAPNFRHPLVPPRDGG